MSTWINFGRWLTRLPGGIHPQEEPPSLDFTAHAACIGVSLQRFGVRESDLEDLLQDVLLIGYQKLHTFDAERSICAWLRGIGWNVAAAHQRRAYVRHERTIRSLSDAELEDACPDPEATAATREARVMLEAILDELDPDKRAVFVMFEIEEIDCDQIAVLLKVPIGTVYSRLFAARKSFEKALARGNARDARRGRS